jgi:hypothetical protein
LYKDQKAGGGEVMKQKSFRRVLVVCGAPTKGWMKRCKDYKERINEYTGARECEYFCYGGLDPHLCLFNTVRGESDV